MKLGKKGPEITRLGLGAWAIGGGQRDFGWGPLGAGDVRLDDDAPDEIARIVEDTAPGDGPARPSNAAAA